MVHLDATKISEELYSFLTTIKNPALFAGAGVGAHAGLPSWPQLMEHLASVADSYEPTTGDLIRQRARGGHYLSSAAVYKSIPEMPIGELYKQVSIPFLDPPSPKKLRALVSLPFTAIFTTNYDRSLHDAFSEVFRKSPKTVELGDPTMGQAPYFTDFFIARMHGRAEVPQSIVFAQDDYGRIENDDCYVDFTRHILTNYSCLFLGFSFVDPAINSIFQLIENRLSPNFPSLHLAFLPADADRQLKSRLANFNIKIVEYEASGNHSVLWNGITSASRKFTRTEKIGKPEAHFPPDAIKRFIATSYARVKLDPEIQPLQDMVVDGIILDLLSDMSVSGLSFEGISNSLREILALSIEESRRLTRRRVEFLSGRGWCHVEDNTIKTSKKTVGTLENDMNILVSGIVYRADVREGERVSALFRDIAAKCVEEVLLARGWDLGAHYARVKGGDLPSILTTISASVEKHSAQLPENRKEKLTFACYDLFQNPDETESTILAWLGRSSFALQVVLNNPCATIAHGSVLPEHIYLDASFLMPAIVEGHPFHTIYSDTLNRYRDASRAAGLDISIAVGESFLNEIISHREIALRDFENLSIGDPDAISNYVQFFGIDAVNVFIGAYLNRADRLERAVSFNEFLNRSAPYRTEQELAKYLNSIGIDTIKLRFRSGTELDLYQKINSTLSKAYESDTRTKYDRKKTVLIEHEARQLARLAIDLNEGLKPIFVSADARLRRLASGPLLERPGQTIISNRGLIQLIDLLVGIRSDPVITSRLLWGSVVIDEIILVRDYLINRAMQYRDEAMTMSLPDVLNEVVPKGIEAAKNKSVNLTPYSASEDKLRTVRFLDFLENRFYANMAEVIYKKFPDEYNLAKETHRKHLLRTIEYTRKAINNYESKLETTENDKEREYYQRELDELRSYLRDYNSELEALSGSAT